MLRVVLIDGGVSAEVVAAIEALTNAKGKPLRAAVLKPDAELGSAQGCQSALRDIGSRASMSECLFAARAQGAALDDVLQFEDEAELPLLVAARVAASGRANLEVALGCYLRMRQAIELNTVLSVADGRVDFQGLAWRAVTGEELLDLSGVLVPVATAGFVSLRADGGIVAVTVSEPAQVELTEARNFVASLVHHGQVSAHTKGQRVRGTHEIITDAEGQRRLVRVRSGTR